MKLHIRRKAKRAGRMLVRGAAFFALAAKLLVPVGYMPAALAEGGFSLCRSGLQTTAPHASAYGSSEHDDAHAGQHSSGFAHEHDEAPGSGHEWERCSLGALGSLAAVPTDWRIALAPSAQDQIASTETSFLPRPAVVGFRPRAPPIADPSA